MLSLIQRSRLPALIIGIILPFRSASQPAESYPPHPDSVVQPGVPKGSVQKYSFNRSQIFPGSERDYWVYVPAQYDPARPACVYVNQDGIQFNAPAVFDNLIAKKEMPVTVGVFVTPGVVRNSDTNALPRYNRSFEYDGLGPNYIRFLLEELLPDVETKSTPDGQPIRLSRSGNDRAIGGSSSGAVCAFTAAWERPNAFSRVFSAIGTYVGLRGGQNYSTLIRKYEPKPIRVFLQDGAQDLNIYAGDWWMANQAMQRALAFAGYDVRHVWGEGAHNGKHATAIFPDAMRWLWRDWPEPIRAGVSSNAFLRDLLIPGEDWVLVGEGYTFTEGTAVNAQGEVFFNDSLQSRTYRVLPAGAPELVRENTQGGDGQNFGPDGRMITVAGANSTIVAWNADGQAHLLTSGFKGNDLVARHDGLIYVTEPGWDQVSPGKVWLLKPNGEKQVVDTGLKFPNGVTLSPDQTLLYVSDSRTHWVYSYQIGAGGVLLHKQRFFHLHVPDTADDSGADGMRCDQDGRLYVATRMGIQVCDQAGRVNCILPTPNGRVSNLTFGGRDFDTIYAACGDKVYARKTKVKGALSFAAPIRPTAPRL